MKKPLIVLMSTLTIVTIAFYALFTFKEMKPFDFGDRIWIHHTGLPANTMEGISESIKRGYNGIECDVFYLEKEDRFVLTHDWPPQSNPTYLDEVFREHQNSKLKLWIDFKNAELKNFSAVVRHLKALEEKYKFKGRYFVESTNHPHQVLLSWSDIDATMWLQKHQHSQIAWLRRLVDKIAVSLGNFISVSASVAAYGPELESSYNHIPKLIFTVNDRNLQERLLSDPSIKTILVDLP